MEKSNYEELEYLVKELSGQILELNDKVSTLSSDVGSTTAHTKAFLYEFLSYEINRIERLGGNLSVIFFAINNLDKVMNIDGIDMANIIEDQVLKLVKDSIRNIDVLGKFGNNEYMIILPDTNPNMGSIAGNRLKRIIEKEVFPVNPRISISMVIKQYEGETASNMIKIAKNTLELEKRK